MAERYVLDLAERSVKYAEDPAHPDRVTEIWRMNKRGPGEIGALYDYIEAKITEGPHLNRNKVQWELEWKSQNMFAHQTARQGHATMNGFAESKVAAIGAIHHWAEALTNRKIPMVSPVDLDKETEEFMKTTDLIDFDVETEE